MIQQQQLNWFNRGKLRYNTENVRTLNLLHYSMDLLCNTIAVLKNYGTITKNFGTFINYRKKYSIIPKVMYIFNV